MMALLVYGTLLLCVLGFHGTQAKSDVYIYSTEYRNPQVTSSTLTWVDINADKMDWPPHMVEAAEDGDREVYICLGDASGQKVPGTLKKPNCTVTLYGSISHPRKFAVLVNQEGSALLKWEPIKMGLYQKDGAVSTGKHFYIARVWDENENRYMVGKLDTTENKIIVERSGHEERHSNGEILVELLPAHYTLDNIQLIHRGAEYKEEQVPLKKITLTNPDAVPKIISQKVTIPIEEQVSWPLGTGTYWDTHRTIKYNGRVLDLKNDIRHKESRTLSKVMDFHLPPDSEVEVQFFGRKLESRVQFRGTLVTDFPDVQQTRKITGIHESIQIVEIKAKYNGYNVDTEDVGMIESYFIGPYVSTTTTTSTTTERVEVTTFKKVPIAKVTETQLPQKLPTSNPPESTTTYRSPLPPWVVEEPTKDASLNSRQQHDKPEAQEVSQDGNSASAIHSTFSLLVLLMLLVIR